MRPGRDGPPEEIVFEGGGSSGCFVRMRSLYTNKVWANTRVKGRGFESKQSNKVCYITLASLQHGVLKAPHPSPGPARSLRARRFDRCGCKAAWDAPSCQASHCHQSGRVGNCIHGHFQGSLHTLTTTVIKSYFITVFMNHLISFR